jgi:4-amino-4-deoxy-L-arabinose transferase-like glycosyltransferase
MPRTSTLNVRAIRRDADDRWTLVRPISRDAQDRWVVLGLVVIAVAIPVLLAGLSGSLLLPHNDDFGYRRVASTLYESGRLQFTGWTIMTVIGQIAFAMPFLLVLQGSSWAFAASSVTLAVIGIAASYVLARRILPLPRAALAVLVVVLFPGFILTATTFMTDIPAFAGEMLCLAIGVIALGRTAADNRWRWLVASLIIGCWAFSIREFAFAAPMAVLISAMASRSHEPRRSYLLAVDVVLAACASIYLVAHNLPGQPVIHLTPFPPGAVAHIVAAVTTVSLMLAPALVLAAATWIPIWRRPTDAAGRRTRHRATVGAWIGLAVGVLLASLFVQDDGVFPSASSSEGTGVIVGNLFGQTGAMGGEVLAGTRPELYPPVVWTGLEIVAILAAFAALAGLGAALGAGGRDVIRGLDVRRHDSPLGSALGMLVAFVTLYTVELVLFGSNASTHDRYLWPLGLPLAILLLWRPSDDRVPALRGAPVDSTRGREDARRGIAGWLAGAMLFASAVMSMVLILNAVAFDTARWRVGEAEEARGTPAMSIDAGVEWLGYHATDIADLDAPYPAHVNQYTRLWPSFRECVVVSSSQIDWPGLSLANERPFEYRSLLVVGQLTPLYVYRSSAPGCLPR